MAVLFELSPQGAGVGGGGSPPLPSPRPGGGAGAAAQRELGRTEVLANTHDPVFTLGFKVCLGVPSGLLLCAAQHHSVTVASAFCQAAAGPWGLARPIQTTCAVLNQLKHVGVRAHA
jgi:hypothetical protein